MSRKTKLLIAGLAVLSGLGLGRLYGRSALIALAEASIRRRFPEVETISTTELAGWLADPSRTAPLLIDTRKAEEIAVSRLPGAVWAGDGGAELEKLAAREPERPIVVYCSLGYRSALAAERLAAAGHRQVFNLEGSIFAWANEGRPLVRGEREVHEVHPYGAVWGRLFLDASKVRAVMEPG